jgi:hypothetical protein
MNCDSCYKKMGIMIMPDDIDGNTIKQILMTLSVAFECELCSKRIENKEKSK